MITEIGWTRLDYSMNVSHGKQVVLPTCWLAVTDILDHK
jgi:hypothetical protein